jgi:hypothetical protein
MDQTSGKSPTAAYRRAGVGTFLLRVGAGAWAFSPRKGKKVHHGFRMFPASIRPP